MKPCFKKSYSIISIVLLIVPAIVFCFCTASSPVPSEPIIYKGDTLLVHIGRPPYIPTTADFAGEAIPLNCFDIHECLERELIVNMNFHSNTIQYLKRITRYFPVIEPILKANGVPDDFKYLSLIESDFMNKVSPKGATGFWQFMKGAAVDYGLEVNNEVDERYHLEKSTEAACKYIKEAYSIFGNWTMAAASYNMGKAALSQQVKRQKCDYYYDLLLNDETMRYLYRIIAVKLILNTPERYGFFVDDSEKYQEVPYTTVEVKSDIPNWVDFAFKYHTNYKMLKYMNPWLRDNMLSNKLKKTYQVKIPATGYRGDSSHQIDEKEAEKIEKESEKLDNEIHE